MSDVIVWAVICNKSNKMYYWQDASASIAVSPTSIIDIVGQRNKIWGIIFMETLLEMLYVGFFAIPA